MIHTFVEHLDPEDVKYDVVSGISVGALNAAHVSTYSKGQEKMMAEDLVKLWTNMTEENLY